MNKQYKITLDNKINELSRLAKQIDEIADENNFSETLKFNLNLSLDEIVTNIISYGYKDDLQHLIEINIMINNTLIVEIIDDGIEFNPLNASKPELDVPLEERKIGGLGIFLVNSLMDKVDYIRENNKNIIKLYKFINKQLVG